MALARGPAAAPPDPPIDFVRDVQPILSASCVKCHRASRPEGGLRLDTREGLLEGGDSGGAVVRGRRCDTLRGWKVKVGSMRIPKDEG